MTEVGSAAGNAARNARMVAQGAAIVAAADREGISARLIGGGAVLTLLPSRIADGHRPLHDLDLIVRRGQQRRLTDLLVGEFGYREEDRFNAMHGSRRLLFHGEDWDLDVMVDPFEMCHRIEVGDRLANGGAAVDPTDLLIMKLQIVELTAKDLLDLQLLLAAPDIDFDEGRLQSLVRGDWGLWRTLHGALERLRDDDAEIAARSATLLSVIDDAPKSARFRVRAAVGERVQWYTLPDESQ